jgi:hypothetical protein
MIEKHTKPSVPHEQAHDVAASGGTQSALPADSPTADWTKTQLKAWLDSEGYSYASDATKAELLTIAGVN